MWECLDDELVAERRGQVDSAGKTGKLWIERDASLREVRLFCGYRMGEWDGKEWDGMGWGNI